MPDTYQGLEVREIGDGAFADCGGITAVNIPSSVDKIGANAFENCLGLEKVRRDWGCGGSTQSSDEQIPHGRLYLGPDHRRRGHSEKPYKEEGSYRKSVMLRG